MVHHGEDLEPLPHRRVVTCQRRLGGDRPAKAGKTAPILNLARFLIIAEPFLDRLVTRRVAGPVGLLNYEACSDQLDWWLPKVALPRGCSPCSCVAPTKLIRDKLQRRHHGEVIGI